MGFWERFRGLKAYRLFENFLVTFKIDLGVAWLFLELKRDLPKSRLESVVKKRAPLID
jgi:hypothetical protein